MSLGSGTSTKLDGPTVVRAFLGELNGYLYGTPDNTIDGTPREIIEMVVENTDRFSVCTEKCVMNLSRQLVMALRAQGKNFHLAYIPLNGGRIRVELA